MLTSQDKRNALWLGVAYLLFAEFSSLGATSRTFPCVLVSQYQAANNQSGYQACAAVHEAVFRVLIFIWNNAGHDNILAFGTVMIAVFTWTLWRSNKKLWETSERQIGLARDDFNATHRPWIQVSVNIGPRGLYFDVNGANLHLIFSCRNTGTTPAIGVYVQCFPFLDTPGWSAIAEQQRIAKEVGARPYHPHAPGFAIFPSDPPVIFNNVYSFISAADMSRRMITSHGLIMPVVLGFVDYSFAFGEYAHHQTGFIYRIHKRGPQGAHLAIRPADGDVPGSDLILERTFTEGGGFFAT